MHDSTDTDTVPAPSWDDRLANLRKRKPAEVEVIIRDDAAELAVRDAQAAEADVRIQARRRLSEHPAWSSMDQDTRQAEIDADEAVLAARGVTEQARRDAWAASIGFVFRALPPDVYEALPGRYPPTEAQAGEDYRVDPERYVPALISACSVNPLSERQAWELIHGAPVTELDDDDPRVWDVGAVDRTDPPLNQGEVSLMFHSCVQVNERPGSVLLGKGWGSTPD